MRYLALIYFEEGDPATTSPEPPRSVSEAYDRFGRAAEAAGVLLGGNALRITTDGPFAETREALGGYYLLDCKDLDEAIEWASQIPGALTGTIEVRPILELGSEGM